MSPAARVTQTRKRAYYYIKYTLSQPPWGIPIETSDAKLADTLGNSIQLEESLRSLRDGKRNPSKQLVSAFKNLVRGRLLEADVDARLVIPFRT